MVVGGGRRGRETDSFVFGGRCCLSLELTRCSSAAISHSLQPCCLTRCSVRCYVVASLALVVIGVLALVGCGRLSINAFMQIWPFLSSI